MDCLRKDMKIIGVTNNKTRNLESRRRGDSLFTCGVTPNQEARKRIQKYFPSFLPSSSPIISSKHFSYHSLKYIRD